MKSCGCKTYCIRVKNNVIFEVIVEKVFLCKAFGCETAATCYIFDDVKKYYVFTVCPVQTKT